MGQSVPCLHLQTAFRCHFVWHMYPLCTVYIYLLFFVHAVTAARAAPILPAIFFEK